jgi:hypothetical protein
MQLVSNFSPASYLPMFWPQPALAPSVVASERTRTSAP